MLISVVPIGNSKGIRLPKGILEQCQITDKVELEVQDSEIILKPVRKKVREGWADEFKKMHEREDDKLLIDDTLDAESLDWEW